jgi:3-oxoacyl-[acyl-carrier-protein] synthase-3
MHSKDKYADELCTKFPGTKYGWSVRLKNEPDAIPDEEIYPHMNGNFVFKHAVTRFRKLFMKHWRKLVKK